MEGENPQKRTFAHFRLPGFDYVIPGISCPTCICEDGLEPLEPIRVCNSTDYFITSWVLF